MEAGEEEQGQGPALRDYPQWWASPLMTTAMRPVRAAAAGTTAAASAPTARHGPAMRTRTAAGTGTGLARAAAARPWGMTALAVAEEEGEEEITTMT